MQAAKRPLSETFLWAARILAFVMTSAGRLSVRVERFIPVPPFTLNSVYQWDHGIASSLSERNLRLLWGERAVGRGEPRVRD